LNFSNSLYRCVIKVKLYEITDIRCFWPTNLAISFDST
jgi:hypothetical protein